MNLKKIRVGDLFNVDTGSLVDKMYLHSGSCERISVTSSQNGVIGKYDDSIDIPNIRYYSNFISINFFGKAFYHPGKASVEMKVHVLTLKSGQPFTESLGLYLATQLNNLFGHGKYGYGSQLSSSMLKHDDFYLLIPVTDSGQLDIQYMEQYIKRIEAQYIKRIEAQYIKRIEAYLSVLGYDSIDDCELSSQDLKVLSGPDEWGEFRIDKLFDIYPTNHYDLTNDLLFDENGINPVVTNSEVDNGITGFTNLKTNMPGNMITFSDTTSERSIFYQADPFVGYSHVQGLHPINGHQWLKKELLYFMTAFRVASTGKYNYGSKFNRQKALDEVVYLPVHDDGSIDYDYMNAYITAIEKKKVLKLKQAMDHKLDLYREMSHQD